MVPPGIIYSLLLSATVEYWGGEGEGAGSVKKYAGEYRDFLSNYGSLPSLVTAC